MASFQVEGLHVEHAPASPGGSGPARPPLLLVHGAGHGAWCWEHWLDVLPARGWECWALSLRNHPGSFAVDDETYRTRLRVTDYVADVAAVAARIGRPAIVAGHSMGGIVVQAYAAQAFAAQAATGSPRATGMAAPPVPAGIVLLASVPPGAFAPLRSAPIASDGPYLLTPDAAAAHYFHGLEPAAARRLMERLVPESPAVLNAYSLGDGLPIARGEIGCPMLVVSAEHDRTVVPHDRRIADHYGADYLFARGIGHDLMLDRGWERTLDAIEAWLRDRFGAG
ncbi:MAG: alpha/beta hydrolase [Candidatus Lambdaproteobacteria bacterium]|nr:alpha/beta hydrolase [Candidatus Lambdaproteobacteria bacterium]